MHFDCRRYSIYKWDLDLTIRCLGNESQWHYWCVHFQLAGCWRSFQGSKELAWGCQMDRCLAVLPFSLLSYPINSSFAHISNTFHTPCFPSPRCCLSLSPEKYLVFKIQIEFVQWPFHPAEWGLWSATEQRNKKKRQNQNETQWHNKASTDSTKNYLMDMALNCGLHLFQWSIHKRHREGLLLRAHDKIMKPFIIRCTQLYNKTYDKWLVRQIKWPLTDKRVNQVHCS